MESEINKEIKKKGSDICQSNNWGVYISLRRGKKGGQSRGGGGMEGN